MPRRGEHIHKRKDGRWEGRYRAGCGETGKTAYRSVYARTYAEVKQKLREHSDSAAARPLPPEPLFKDAFLMWQEVNQSRRKGATNMKYVNLAEKHILPELGELKLTQFSTVLLSNFMNQKLSSGRIDRKGGLSPSYVRSMMLVVSAVLSFAVSEQLCAPIQAKVYQPAIRRREPEILDAAQQQRLEALLLEDMNGTKLGIYLSLQTGLRIGEVCALAWEDVDLPEAVIHVRHTIARVADDTENAAGKTRLIVDTPKTKTSARDIPISSSVMSVLLLMYGKRASAYVISEREGFVSPRTYEYRFHQVLAEGNLRQVNYHVLRHTFATRCVEAGVDSKSLSELLGHAGVAITLNTYVHSSMERKREQLEKLNAARH